MDKTNFRARGQQEAHLWLLREHHFREPIRPRSTSCKHRFAMNEDVFRVLFTEAPAAEAAAAE